MTNLVAPGLIGASLPFITSTLNSRRAGGKSPRLVSGAGQWATSSIHRKYCTIDYAIRMRGDGFYCVKVSDASRRNSLGRSGSRRSGRYGQNRIGCVRNSWRSGSWRFLPQRVVLKDRFGNRDAPAGLENTTEFAQRRGLVGNVGENRAGGDDIDGGVRDIGQLISVWGADWLLGTAGSIHGIAYRKTAAMPLALYYGCTSGTAGVCTAESVSLNM